MVWAGLCGTLEFAFFSSWTATIRNLDGNDCSGVNESQETHRVSTRKFKYDGLIICYTTPPHLLCTAGRNGPFSHNFP
jgi:hypothetical protein